MTTRETDTYESLISLLLFLYWFWNLFDVRALVPSIYISSQTTLPLVALLVTLSSPVRVTELCITTSGANLAFVAHNEIKDQSDQERFA